MRLLGFQWCWVPCPVVQVPYLAILEQALYCKDTLCLQHVYDARAHVSLCGLFGTCCNIYPVAIGQGYGLAVGDNT